MADLDYQIDIAARMEGNAFSELRRLELALKAAEGEYKALEQSAAKAAKAVEINAGKLDVAKAAQAKAAGTGNVADYRLAAKAVADLTAKERELTAAAAKAKEALAAQGKVVQQTASARGKARDADEQAKAAANVGKLKGAFAGLPGPVGRAGSSILDVADNLGDMKEALGTGTTAAVAGTAAIAALVLALYAGVAAAAYFAVKLADAGRSLRLTVQATLESESAGARLVDSYRRIQRETGATSDRLLALTRSLKAAKVPAEQMPDALRAITLQEQALGDESGTQALIDKLKGGQVAASALADEMKTKFGGIVEQKMRSLPMLAERFKANIAGLFGTLDIEPLLKGIESVVNLFDESTSSGKAMKALFKDIFQPLLNAATKVFPHIQRFLLGLMIGAYEVAIVMKPIAGSIMAAFETGPLKNFADAADIGRGAALALAIAIGAVGAIAALAMGATLMPFALAAAGVYAIYVGVQKLIAAFENLNQQFGETAAGQALQEATGWQREAEKPLADYAKVANEDEAGAAGAAAGENMASSFRSALDEAEAYAAGKAMVDAANRGAKDAGDIHSPSREWAYYGRMLSKGLEVGIDSGKLGVEGAASDIPAPQFNDTMRGGGGTYTWEIHIHGDPTRQTLEDAQDILVRQLEGVALELGLTRTS